MPTQNVNLSVQQVNFIRKAIEAGGFRNASEVIRAGLRLLEQERQESRLKLKLLRVSVKEGFDAIDRGEYELLTDETLPQFLESLKSTKTSRKSA